MRRNKPSEYITIPLRDIELKKQPSEGLGGETRKQTNESFMLEEPASVSKTEDLSNDEAEISYSLDRIASGLDSPVVLLVDYGDQAIPMIRACTKAGLSVAVTCTDDLADHAYLRTASSYISLAPVFSEGIFKNSYAILRAAERCGAEAILIIDPELAEDEFFLGRCKASSLSVFRALDATNPYLGWAICESQVEVEDIEGAWRKCPHCHLLFDRKGLQRNHYICPSCNKYLRMSSKERIKDVLDKESFEEWWPVLDLEDPLEFPGYLEKLEKTREDTGLDEAVVCGAGSIAGMRAAFCFMDSQFFMASMGSVVGEKITRCVERATKESLPLVIFCASGGARMQEGLLSLMQMAKISFAIARHAEKGLLYISVLTDPTTGGVTASFAMQGDIVLAEPKALIGFAGQRVIRDTIRRELPEGFQTAEFALEHGLIDAIIDRQELRARLAELVAMHLVSSSYQYTQTGERITYETVQKYEKLFRDTDSSPQYIVAPHVKNQIENLDQKTKRTPFFNLDFLRLGERFRRVSKNQVDKALEESYEDEEYSSYEIIPAGDVSSEGDSPAWERVQLARNTHRPTSQYYIEAIVDGFIELHGDRGFADDGAILAGLGWIGDQAVTVVAEEKGFDLKDRIARNFGCPKPEGYRKSLRIMKQAEKFGRPIVCFVDTQGAFCGTEAEERGQGNAIAENLLSLSQISVPVISVVIGEGGSGGALALAVADRVAMQENAVYSILSPEGFASILWKDGSRAAEAAGLMKISAEDALHLGVIDTILPEGKGPAHENPETAASSLRTYLVDSLEELSLLPTDNLLEKRFERFRKF